MAASLPSKDAVAIKLDLVVSCRRRITFEQERLCEEISRDALPRSEWTRAAVCEALLGKFLGYVDQCIEILQSHCSVLDGLPMQPINN